METETQTLLDRVDALDGLGPYPEPVTLLERLAALESLYGRTPAAFATFLDRLDYVEAQKAAQ
jgi:hypothetical protein